MPDTMSSAEVGIRQQSGVTDIITPETKLHRMVLPLMSVEQALSVPDLAEVKEINPFVKDILTELYDYHPTTYNHSLRSAIAVNRAAKIFRIPPERVRDLTTAALAHDGGKTRIDKATILDYPGPLSHVKRTEMYQHVDRGAERIPDYAERVRRLIKGHHIPDGYHLLNEEETSDEELIQDIMLLSAMESTDAVRSEDRAYLKIPMTLEEAEGLLRKKNFLGHAIPNEMIQVVLATREQVAQEYPSTILNLDLPV